MNNNPSNSVFEDAVSKSFGVPAIRTEFVNQVYGEIIQRASSKIYKPRSNFMLRPAWSVALFMLLLIILATLAIGPQRVIAAIGRLFGYIPGVGIVDDSAPIRVLAEPVSVTRDGISITVTSATLTGDRTHIDYRIFGVPGSAYPVREDELGCSLREYLRLEEGTQLDRQDNDFQPMPGEINEAVFVIPCIGNTLPGKVPENWEIPLQFVPAPPDLTVMPVFDITPTTLETPSQSTSVEISVEKEIETEDGYILIGAIRPKVSDDQFFEITGVPVIHDANNKKVEYTFPQDIDESQALDLGNNEFGFSFQIKAAGVAFPLTIDIPGKIITPADPDSTAEIDFDAGPNPQAGQEWILMSRSNWLATHLNLFRSLPTPKTDMGFDSRLAKT